MEKPVIAVPLGDPAGIGPEIVVKALSSGEVRAAARCVAVGDRFVVERALRLAGAPLRIEEVSDPARLPADPDALPLVRVDALEDFTPGAVSAACGRAAYDYIEKSVALALAGAADAVTTPPIHKEAMRAGGIPHIGHTEIFGALTGAADPLTMFEVRGMRIFFLTRHVSLRRACDLITKERIVDYVRRCTRMLFELGVAPGTMAVAGLNPHSGEHGLFGEEEMTAVEPAVGALRAEGFDVAGPIGADSVFHLALTGRFSSILSLYHDQGHIAAKTLDFERTIAVTGGMPVLRTSVDHGTAMDIAWKNVASPVSMIEAIRLAAQYAPGYRVRRARGTAN